MIDDDVGTAEQPPVSLADRVAFWLPRVSLVLGCVGVLVWWWLES